MENEITFSVRVAKTATESLANLLNFVVRNSQSVLDLSYSWQYLFISYFFAFFGVSFMLDDYNFEVLFILKRICTSEKMT